MVLAVLIVSQAGAFDVVPLSPSGFTADGELYVNDTSGTHGPLVVNKWDPNDVYIDSYSELYINTSYSYGSASSNGSFSSFEHEPGVLMVDMHLGTNASITNYTAPVDMYANAKIETVTDSSTYGYFFEIVSTAPGELPGDQVNVSMDFNIYANISGNAIGHVTGTNGMDHIAVTLNEYPPVWPGTPSAANEIWTLPNQTITADGYNNYNHTFTAHIGDVIGVFAAADFEVTLTDSGDSFGGCYPSIYFTLELETNPMDFDNDGYVNFADLATFAKEWLWVRPGR